VKENRPTEPFRQTRRRASVMLAVKSEHKVTHETNLRELRLKPGI